MKTTADTTNDIVAWMTAAEVVSEKEKEKETTIKMCNTQSART